MFVTKLKPADKIAGESLRPFACSAVPGLPGAVAEDDCMYEALPSRRPPHSPVLSYTAIGRLPSEVTGGHICSTVTSPGPGSTTSSSRLTIIEPTLRPISPVPLAGITGNFRQGYA